MNHISGMADLQGSGRFEAVLSLFNECSNCELMMSSHCDSKELRAQAKWLFRARWSGDKETVARFELEEVSGMVDVYFFDAQTGNLEYKISPERLVEGLRDLEMDGDNDAPLSSFFVDIGN